MPITKNMEDAFNEQINKEFYSAYLYLSMSAYFDSENMNGFSNWMKAQAQEELTHGMKLFNYVNERGGKVILTSIDTPNNKWETPLSVFEEVYSHEVFVTKLIHELVETAKKEKDGLAESFLQWFVKEQIEEEASANKIKQKLITSKSDSQKIQEIDKELGKRVVM